MPRRLTCGGGDYWIREEGGSAAPIPKRAQGTIASGPVPVATGEDPLRVRVMVGFDVVR